jgi:predicted ATPase
MVVAQALRLNISARNPLDTLIEQSERLTDTILIFDNAEHILQAVTTLIQRLLRQNQFLKIWVTSRLPLGLHDEHTIGIPPLGEAQPDDSNFDTHPALQLFWHSAMASGAKLPEPTEDVQRLAFKLISHLGSLPIAIEMAAAQLRFFSLLELTQKVQDSVLFLRNRKVDASSRHESLTTSFEWSWSLMKPWEQAALAQLSVFTGAFRLEQAVYVVDISAFEDAPDAQEVLFRLVESNLVVEVQARNQKQFMLLGPLREWAKTKLDTLQFCSSIVLLQDCQVDTARGIALYPEEEIRLNSKELALFRRLLNAPGTVVSRKQLLEDVWGYGETVITRTLDTTMRMLRKKVDKQQAHLKTVRSIGYVLEAGDPHALARQEAEARHGQWFVDQKQALSHREVLALMAGSTLELITATKRACHWQDARMFTALLGLTPQGPSYFANIDFFLQYLDSLFPNFDLVAKVHTCRLFHLSGQSQKAKVVCAEINPRLETLPDSEEKVSFIMQDILINGPSRGLDYSISQCKKGLQIAKSCNSARYRAVMTQTLSNRLLRKGDIEGFEQLKREELDKHQCAGTVMLSTSVEYGRLLSWRGEQERARLHFHKAVELATELHFSVGRVWSVNALRCFESQQALSNGDPSEISAALMAMETQARNAADYGNAVLSSDIAVDMGLTYLDSGEPEKALPWLERGLNGSRLMEALTGEARALFGLAWHASLLGRHNVAKQHLQHGFLKLTHGDDPEIWIVGYICKITVLLESQQRAAALQELEIAETLLTRIHMSPSSYYGQKLSALLGRANQLGEA